MVLEPSAVSGLVVVGMEAILEHRRFHVISFVLFLYGKTLYLLPESRCVEIFLFKISERVGTPVSLSEFYSPSVAAPFGLVHPDSDHDFSGPGVGTSMSLLS